MTVIVSIHSVEVIFVDFVASQVVKDGVANFAGEFIKTQLSVTFNIIASAESDVNSSLDMFRGEVKSVGKV